MSRPPLPTPQIYTHIHKLTNEEFQASLDEGKDLWKKMIERVGSCNSLCKSHYVGNHQLHLDLAPTLIP